MELSLESAVICKYDKSFLTSAAFNPRILIIGLMGF